MKFFFLVSIFWFTALPLQAEQAVRSLQGTPTAQPLDTARKNRAVVPSSRSLRGRVTDMFNHPLPKAKVTLKCKKLAQVRTVMADDKGVYLVTGLNMHVQYTVIAEWKGKRSNTKTLSPVDERVNPQINITIYR